MELLAERRPTPRSKGLSLSTLQRRSPRTFGLRPLAVGALALLGAVAGGCYAPALRDCTVSCDSQAHCAGDQICGSDGLCAAPGVAGHCAQVGTPQPTDAQVKIDLDARPPGPARDAAVAIDAPAPSPDAPTTATLRVQIHGKGSVFVDGLGACTAGQDQQGDCGYEVALGVAVTARARASQFDQRFASWSSVTCRSAGATCTFTPTTSLTIVARFDKVP